MIYQINYIKDGVETSIQVNNAKERDETINALRGKVSFLSWFPVFKGGPGKTTVVVGKKYFCTADVHSFYDELIEALKKAGFDKNNPDHVFVHCGDLLDRGPDAMKCLEFVNSLPRKILIKGNHEDLLEDILFRKKWFDCYDFHNGTVDTISQLSGIRFENMDSFLQYAMIDACKNNEELKKYLDSVVDYAEIGDHIIVHGWIPITTVNRDEIEDGDWKNGDWEESRWLNGMKMWEEGRSIEGKTIVCGHWGTMWGHERCNKSLSHDIFQKDGIVALDATTVLSHRVNVYTFEA